MTYTATFEETIRGKDLDMGERPTTNPIVKHWQFLLQLGIIVFACGGFYQAHTEAMRELVNAKEEIHELRALSQKKSEAIIELKTDVEWIKRKLQELESKKIVNRIASDDSGVAGENYAKE